MIDKQHFMNNLWRWKCGDREIEPTEFVTYEELAFTEWSLTFEQLMKSRLVIGSLRYGRLRDPFRRRFNWAEGVQNRLNEYIATGNIEKLVDVANLALLEFHDGRHPNKHFTPTDDTVHVNPEKRDVATSR